MKQFIGILIFFTLIAFKANAQPLTENTYYPENYLNKFEGSWMWSSGADTVRLHFKKVALKIIRFNNSYAEFLLGTHSYVRNGNLVETSMNEYDSLTYYTSTNRIGTLRLFRVEDDDTSYAGGTLADRSKHKGNQIDLTYLGGSPIQIRMQLSAKPGATVSLPGNPYIDGITLPVDIILFKQ